MGFVQEMDQNSTADEEKIVKFAQQKLAEHQIKRKLEFWVTD